jgi:hypothetical protein
MKPVHRRGEASRMLQHQFNSDAVKTTQDLLKHARSLSESQLNPAVPELKDRVFAKKRNAVIQDCLAPVSQFKPWLRFRLG